MRLIARAPIDATLAGRDLRPGDVFEVEGGQARPLLDSGAAEVVQDDAPKADTAETKKRAK